MAGPEAIVTALLDFFVAFWPHMAIGAAIGVVFAWKRWVPVKWAQLKNAVQKGHNFGVLFVRLRGRAVKEVIVDFAKQMERTPYGAFNPSRYIFGHNGGISLALVNTSDVDSVPAFKNDYKAEDMMNPSSVSDSLEAAFIAGQISQAKQDKIMFYLAVAAAVGIVVVGFLVFDMRGQMVAFGNWAAVESARLSNLTASGWRVKQWLRRKGRRQARVCQ